MATKVVGLALAVMILGVTASHVQGVYSVVTGMAQGSKQSCSTFETTGKTLCEPFLSFWQRYGGIPIFGYPISNTFPEVSQLDGNEYIVQYFERSVFELHPENAPPYNILLSHLGTTRFTTMHPNGENPSAYEEQLPIYPGAQDVSVQHPKDSPTRNITRFTTTDSPTGVSTYYKDLLAKNKWRLDTETPDVLVFYFQLTKDDELYMLKITLGGVPQGHTSIELTLNVFGVLPPPFEVKITPQATP
jgi:hypothetical protein